MISENLKLTEKYTKHQFFVRKIERIFSSPGIQKQLRELSGKLETKIKAVILSEHYIEMFANAQSNFFCCFVFLCFINLQNYFYCLSAVQFWNFAISFTQVWNKTQLKIKPKKKHLKETK